MTAPKAEAPAKEATVDPKPEPAPAPKAEEPAKAEGANADGSDILAMIRARQNQ